MKQDNTIDPEIKRPNGVPQKKTTVFAHSPMSVTQPSDTKISLAILSLVVPWPPPVLNKLSAPGDNDLPESAHSKPQPGQSGCGSYPEVLTRPRRDEQSNEKRRDQVRYPLLEGQLLLAGSQGDKAPCQPCYHQPELCFSFVIDAHCVLSSLCRPQRCMLGPDSPCCARFDYTPPQVKRPSVTCNE